LIFGLLQRLAPLLPKLIITLLALAGAKKKPMIYYLDKLAKNKSKLVTGPHRWASPFSLFGSR
jgi:hypothetical protein